MIEKNKNMIFTNYDCSYIVRDYQYIDFWKL